MQPHHPFISSPDLDKGSFIAEDDKYLEQQSRTVWEQLEAGELEEDEVLTEYRNNLRIVLEDVQILLENVDSETAVITSDHGNAIGEWGDLRPSRRNTDETTRQCSLVRNDRLR